MTPEQKKTIAIASARKRMAQAKPEADMSFGGRLKDNIIGVDDGVQSFGEKIAAGLNSAGEAMTVGVVGDEAAAAADALVGRGKYDERRDRYRSEQAQFREENPVTAFATDVAGSLVGPGLGAAKVAGMAATKIGRVGAASVAGAGSGAVYGFAEGEDSAESRAKNAAITASLGGLLGAASPKIGDVIQGLPRRVTAAFQRSQQRPSVDTLRAAKNAAYKAVDDSGEVFSPAEMQGLLVKVKTAFDDGNYVEETDNALRATLTILERRAPKDTTISQLDGVRQNLWKRYAGAKDQPQILDAIGAIDDLVEQRAGASALMAAARAANSRYAKSQLLEDAFTKATDQTAGAGSGGNILNKYRQAVTSIINDKKKAKFFSEDEITLMREFVRGSTSENAKRLIGKLSPSGNGLMMALHVVGGMASSGATLPLMAVGAGAKASADKSAMRGASAIQDVVSGFAKPKSVPALSRPATAGAVSTIPLLESEQSRFRNALAR